MNFALGSNGKLEGEDLLTVVKPEVIDQHELLLFYLRKPATIGVEVTGITAPSAESNERSVEYTITFRDLPAIVKLFAVTNIRSKTTFTRFDDGWRPGASNVVEIGPVAPPEAFTEAEAETVEAILKRVHLERQAEHRMSDSTRTRSSVLGAAEHAAVLAGMTSVFMEASAVQAEVAANVIIGSDCPAEERGSSNAWIEEIQLGGIAPECTVTVRLSEDENMPFAARIERFEWTYQGGNWRCKSSMAAELLPFTCNQ